jgi:2-oxo-3-hexenedioate decarboxylase
MTIDVAALARTLDEARRAGRPIPRLSNTTDLDTPTAYAVQAATIELRQAHGEAVTGVKMGFTSRAKMVQMGVADLIWGRLTDAMAVPDGGVLPTRGLIHPRIEPEVAFLLGERHSVAGVAVAFEVIDSRYEDFRFTVPEVVADNASAAAFGTGRWHPPQDVSNLGVVLEIDGQPAQIGSTAAILGDPLRALAAAIRLASAAGVDLPAGSIVLAGAACAAVPLPVNTHVRVEAARLGRAEVITR